MTDQKKIEYTNEQPQKTKGRAQESDKLVGQKIRQYRKALKLTQNDLAEKLGISFQQIQKYENGKSRISFTQLSELCQLMNVPISAFDVFDTSNDSEKDYELSDNAKQELLGQYGHSMPLKDSEIEELLSIYSSIDDPEARKNFLEAFKTLATSFKK